MEKIKKQLFIVLCLIGSLFAAPTSLLETLPTRNIYGKPIAYTKSVYLIDVWATWCPPCKMTVPELVALQKEITENFSVIGLSVDDTKEPVVAFAKQNKINYPVAMATGTVLNVLPPVRGIPTLFIVKDGVIVKTIVGYTPKETLRGELQPYLK